MVAIEIAKFPTSSPADTTPLSRLLDSGYDVSQILAVIGKTEGNGCVNDFSRTLAAAVWTPLIPQHAITIFSGGTEGVLSPHVTFILKSNSATGDSLGTGLTGVVGHTRDFLPHEIGTRVQVDQVAHTISHLIDGFGVSRNNVHLVLVKCPLLTTDKIEAIRAAGYVPITTDTYESMAKSRYATAVGIAKALGEIEDAQITSALTADGAETVWSAKASCSSGAELDGCHIFVLASSESKVKNSTLRAVSGYMKDAIDLASITDLLSTCRADGGEVVQVFAKAEADPRGIIRGSRHTMNTDSDLHGTRHARAAVGGLIAGVTGDCEVYVSGGAEGQGPVGGGGLCIVYRVPK